MEYLTMLQLYLTVQFVSILGSIEYFLTQLALDCAAKSYE